MHRRFIRLAGGIAAVVAGALLLGAASTRPAKPADAARALKHGEVLIIAIKGDIDRVQNAFLQRSLAGAKGKYDAVIFDITSGGGRTDLMAKMSDTMIRLKPTRTIAFVSSKAMSAAAFIAMSTDVIYMEPRSRIGAARGWVPGRDGLPATLPKHIEEKLMSDLRVEFRALAECDNGKYPPAIAEGMVDDSKEVSKVVYDGKTKYMTDAEVANTKADPVKADKLRIVEVISPKGDLITFTAKEAVEYNVATAVLGGLDAVIEAEGLAGGKRVTKVQTWSDKAIAVLTLPQLAGLLILIGFGGIWLEMKMPGFGVPGTIAVIAFLLVFSSQFLVGNANAAEILLFLVGVALLAIELFVTPGFGIIGGAGVACVFISLILAMQSFTVPTDPWETQTFKLNLMATFGGVLGSLLVLLAAAWLLPGTPLFRKLTLQKELRTEDGFGSGVQDGETLISQVGTVVTALRPAGKLEIGDKTYSVVSDAEFVDAGAKARVIRVDGPKIVVEPLEAEEPKEPEFQA